MIIFTLLEIDRIVYSKFSQFTLLGNLSLGSVSRRFTNSKSQIREYLVFILENRISTLIDHKYLLRFSSLYFKILSGILGKNSNHRNKPCPTQLNRRRGWLNISLLRSLYLLSLQVLRHILYSSCFWHQLLGTLSFRRASSRM